MGLLAVGGWFAVSVLGNAAWNQPYLTNTSFPLHYCREAKRRFQNGSARFIETSTGLKKRNIVEAIIVKIFPKCNRELIDKLYCQVEKYVTEVHDEQLQSARKRLADALCRSKCPGQMIRLFLLICLLWLPPKF